MIRDQANVLLLGARRRVFFCQRLKAVIAEEGRPTRVLACDTDRLDPIRHFADEFFLLPPSASADFLPVLCDRIHDRGIGLVIGWNDADIDVLNRRRDELAAAGAELALPAAEHVTLFYDKRLTAEWARANGVPHPKVFARAEAEFPLVVKPRWGQGSYGIKRYDSAASFRADAEQFAEDQFVFQEWVDGEEYTVDAAFDQHASAVCVVPRRRIKVRAGEVLIAQVDLAADVLALARDVGAKLGHRGLMNLQAIRSRDRLVLLEMNPRFGGGSDLTIAAGADLARYALEIFWYGDIRSPSPTIQDGLVMSRYWAPVFFDE